MGLLIENGVVEVLSFVILALLTLYLYLTKDYDYWIQRGVPCNEPEFPFGSTKDIILTRTFTGKGYDNIYKLFPNDRYFGIIDFRIPTLVVKDPDLIKLILVKDFHSFSDRLGLTGNPKEYMLKHLLNLVGKEWKDMRSKLTPTFTSGKLKMMFVFMEGCSQVLKEKLDKEIKVSKVIDAKDVLAKFTLDIIATCAFGLDINSQTQKDGTFYHVLGDFMKTTKVQYIKRLLILFFPDILRIFRINTIQPEVRDFVTNLVRDTTEFRKKNNINRNDFLDLLIHIKQNKQDYEDNNETTHETSSSAEELTIEQMAAQTFVFFIAGFETSSSMMAFCLYELSRHQDIQEELYNKIKEAVDSNGGEISYQVLMQIPYLDQVIDETLRLYGSGQILIRKCTQTYKIPDSDLIVEKGTKVVVPIYAIHHDPKYYPDPYEFRPERFTPEETKKRHPFVYMPFGEGPRNCIGMRFGLMQTKVGLSTVLLHYQLKLSSEQEVPIKFNKRSLTLMPEKPVLLEFNKRKS